MNIKYHLKRIQNGVGGFLVALGFMLLVLSGVAFCMFPALAVAELGFSVWWLLTYIIHILVFCWIVGGI